jgi:hypothetical protein
MVASWHRMLRCMSAVAHAAACLSGNQAGLVVLMLAAWISSSKRAYVIH